MLSTTHQTTICALSTAPMLSAIGVIRLSGPHAISIAEKCFSKTLNNKQPNSVHYGVFKQNNQILDEVVISLFKAPHSYTGEDVVEISCHGSLYILEEVLKTLLAQGATPASPGEFSMRAFLNGKLDLSQAEAVADLISSENKASHQIAINQLRGGFSNELKTLREELIHFASLIELELDFAEEDVEFADRAQLNQLFDKIHLAVTTLINSFQYGNVLKSGVPVAIVGAPNAGKSTLLNTLLNEEKAIVSPIAGTTRDVIEDTLVIGGVKFRLIDTAGIRNNPDNEIERIGIERTNDRIQKANIILYLAVAGNDQENETEGMLTGIKAAQQIQEKFPDKKIILVGTKFDLSEKSVGDLPLNTSTEYIAISAKTGTGIEQLKNSLLHYVKNQETHYNNIVVTNTRHINALEKAKLSLEAVKTGMQQQLSGDLIAIDIRATIHHLGEITGTISTEDLLGNIFSKFCIGK